MKLTFEGGINENDGTMINECQEGYNFDLVYGDTNLTPRKSLDLKGTSPNAGAIAGILQLIKRDDTETTLVFDDDGAAPEVFLWDGSDSFTSKRTANLAVGSKLRDVYWSLDDRLAIVDISKSTPLMTWDGTTFERHKTALVDGAGVSVTGITQTAGVATVTYGAVHGRSIGDLVTFYGAGQAGYNIEAEVLSVPTTTTLTYAVDSGTASPATGTITADAGVDLYAAYGVIHNNRQWLFNVKTVNGATTSDTPHLMVASAFENIESYDTAARAEDNTLTGNEAFYILSPNLKPVNGVAQFNKELIISTVDGRLFRLIGNDATNYQWVDYYAGSAAIGTETMVNFGNDVAFMRKGGRIDTLRQTDASGDVTLDDISRWIPNLTRNLTDAIAVYDSDKQRVLFFVQNKVLVLYKEYLYGSDTSPWSVFTTELSFRFNTSAAVRIRKPGLAGYSVYLGGTSGKIYDLSGTGDGDEGTTGIQVKRKSNLIDTLRTKEAILNGEIHYRRVGEVDVTMYCDWSEEYNITSSIVKLKGRGAGDTASSYFGGAAYFSGDFYFNAGFQFQGKPTTQRFSPSGRGPAFFFEVNTNSVYSFQIDYITLGA